MILLRLLNLILLLGLVVCLAGAMAGLIVFAPFVGGAWFLTLIAIVGSDPESQPPQTRSQSLPATRPAERSKPTASGRPAAWQRPQPGMADGKYERPIRSTTP